MYYGFIDAYQRLMEIFQTTGGRIGFNFRDGENNVEFLLNNENIEDFLNAFQKLKESIDEEKKSQDKLD